MTTEELAKKVYAAIVHLHDDGYNCGDLVGSTTAAESIAAEIQADPAEARR